MQASDRGPDHSPGHLVTLSPCHLAGYAGMLLAAAGLLYVIDVAGDRLEAPEPVARERHELVSGGEPDALVHVLIALTAVVAVGRLLGWLFQHLGQPPMMGDVVGGILLGPSVLGQVWPAAAQFVLPAAVA